MELADFQQHGAVGLVQLVDASTQRVHAQQAERYLRAMIHMHSLADLVVPPSTPMDPWSSPSA